MTLLVTVCALRSGAVMHSIYKQSKHVHMWGLPQRKGGGEQQAANVPASNGSHAINNTQ